MVYKVGEMPCAQVTYQVAQAVPPGKLEPTRRPATFGGTDPIGSGSI